MVFIVCSTIYVKELGLQDTTDDINMVLKKIANKPGLEGKLHAARQFIAMYREGKLSIHEQHNATTISCIDQLSCAVHR